MRRGRCWNFKSRALPASRPRRGWPGAGGRVWALLRGKMRGQARRGRATASHRVKSCHARGRLRVQQLPGSIERTVGLDVASYIPDIHNHPTRHSSVQRGKVTWQVCMLSNNYPPLPCWWLTSTAWVSLYDVGQVVCTIVHLHPMSQGTEFSRYISHISALCSSVSLSMYVDQ